jgi:hypothetical protein
MKRARVARARAATRCRRTCCRRPAVRGTRHDWKGRRRRWAALEQDDRRSEVFGWLREAFAEGEAALVGWRNIVGYLASLGLRNRIGGLPTERTARVWKRELRAPILAGCRGIPSRRPSSPPFTTNFLILSWLASLFSTGGAYPILVERSDEVSEADSSADRPVCSTVPANRAAGIM